MNKYCFVVNIDKKILIIFHEVINYIEYMYPINKYHFCMFFHDSMYNQMNFEIVSNTMEIKDYKDMAFKFI